jgi:acyl carrier protein
MRPDSELDVQLERCFRAVFPALEPASVHAASVDSVPEWDSLQAIVLIAVLEEAFEQRIDPRAYSALRSYGAVREYISTHGPGGGRPAEHRDRRP